MKINNEKKNLDPLCPQSWGCSSAAIPLKICDVMPPYLKTLLKQKQEIDNFKHFRLNDPLRLSVDLTRHLNL